MNSLLTFYLYCLTPQSQDQHFPIYTKASSHQFHTKLICLVKHFRAIILYFFNDLFAVHALVN